MREFTTAVKRKEAEETEERESITFKHDGREVTFLKPTDTQMTLLMSSGLGYGGALDGVSTVLAIFFDTADAKTSAYFRHRLFDPKDPFDINTPGGVYELLEGLVEEWVGRPTKQPGDYMPSQASTGRSSTAKRRTKVSTSSPSRRTGSATPSTPGQSPE